MFYEPGKSGHGLPHDPFKSLVVPRPIGWISTYAKDGTPNLAPYSFFNAVGFAPPMVIFSSGTRRPDRVNGRRADCGSPAQHKQRDECGEEPRAPVHLDGNLGRPQAASRPNSVCCVLCTEARA